MVGMMGGRARKSCIRAACLGGNKVENFGGCSPGWFLSTVGNGMELNWIPLIDIKGRMFRFC